MNRQVRAMIAAALGVAGVFAIAAITGAFHGTKAQTTAPSMQSHEALAGGIEQPTGGTEGGFGVIGG